MQRLLVLSVLAVFTASPAYADLVVFNTNEPDTFSIAPGTATEMQGSFTTGGGGPLVLDFVTVRISSSNFLNNAPASATWTAHLRSDGGGSPGGEISTSSSVVFNFGANDTGPGMADTQFEFVNFQLSANTTYWLGVTRTESLPNMISGAQLTANTNETSGFGWTLGNDTYFNGALSQAGSPLHISVEAVPEPSTFAMLGVAGIAGIWHLRRRRAVAAQTEAPKAA